uniref:thiol oxidase n=1 Tax=viral metagenome TaxID=1070528 RepID=A0A6C0KP29_9ZZZZ
MEKTKTKTNKNRKLKNKTRKNNNRVFKNGDFYSGDGFLTTVWGPPQWHMLHTISFNYPVNPSPEQKKQYRDYVLSLQNILPCSACRKNLKTNFKHLPLTMKDMKNRDSFSRYIYNLHELVNKMLHKKSNLTYCDIRERYEHFRSRCTDEKPKVFKFDEIKEKKEKKEKGCTEPLYGKKAKCILKIVPQDEKGATLQIDKKCLKTKE